MRRYAGVIATCRDTVLLVREPHEGGFLLWGLPSGRVEEGETFAEGAARELAEESGLIVSAGDLIEACRVELRMLDGIESDAVTYTIEVEQHEVRIDDPDGSVQEGGWFPIDDALVLIPESAYLSMVEPVVHFLRNRTTSTWRYTDPRVPGVLATTPL